VRLCEVSLTCSHIWQKRSVFHSSFSFEAPPKRFYKNTNVLSSDGSYEITLDQRKLKTPKGQVFKVRNKPLALAVAAEWDAQKEKILQTNMHLVSITKSEYS